MTQTGARVLRMDGSDWALLLLLSVLWGGSFFFFKVLVGGLPPLTIVFARVSIAALLLNAVLVWRRDLMPRDGASWRAFAVMGLLNNIVPFGLLIYGETKIPSGLAAILNATTPMFAVLVAHLFATGEALTANRLAGIGIGFLGVVVLMAPGLLSDAQGGDLLAEGACVLAAVSYGFAVVYGRRFRGIPPVKVAAGQLTASSVIALPLCLAFDHPWTFPLPTAEVWGALMGLAVPSTAVAYLMFFRILARAGGTNASLVTLLVPVSAVLLGALFLGETLGPAAFAGMALIGVGLLCIDGRVFQLGRLMRA